MGVKLALETRVTPSDVSRVDSPIETTSANGPDFVGTIEQSVCAKKSRSGTTMPLTKLGR